MMQYQCVIFDWDGTVMDSADKIIACMQHAASVCQLPIPTNKEVAHIIGISLAPAISQLFSLTHETKIQQVVEAYKYAFLSIDKTPCPLFDGILELFTHIQPHVSLAVATGKARRGLERAWQATNTKQFFIDSCTADEAQSKPHPDMLEQILARQGFNASQCLMVGDTTYDMQMAQAIGMDRIGVDYGVHQPQQLNLHHPKGIISHPLELINFL
ncbi:MAG: 5'-nucleotidase [Glaciecola sp. HTCC2999]|jgi:phosphoglycolate phosphatase|nr:MAG: 5'-nucleotidase [Glaciecola sp. HTCC2999]